MLGAVPATPVQVAHASLAAGFHAVFPASWGDELIAARALQRLRDADGPRVLCRCPHVAKRLGEHFDVIGEMVLHFVPPPVATAQYLRAAYAPAHPHITFAGDCPSAADDSIDACLKVDAFLQSLADKGIVLADQPTEFDSVFPPDRRRYYSDPGGVPCRLALRQLSTPFDLLELGADDLVVEIAQQLLAGSRTIIDPAARLGCSCSGASATSNAEEARMRVRELEPPRAQSPVVDHGVRLTIDVPLLEAVGSESALPIVVRVAIPRPARVPDLDTDSATVSVDMRRRSPAGMSRPLLGATPPPPVRRSDGRQLPRAFVARRRSSPRGGLRQSFMRAAGSRVMPRRRWSWIVAGATAIAAGGALLRYLF